MIRGRRLATRGLLCAAAGAIACGMAAAQAVPCPVSARDSARTWAPPLDRIVTLHSSGGSLRTALDLVAARAGVRLSYSSELLPLDREACVPEGPMPLGAALMALLHGVAVTPAASGGTQVVLAPTRADVSATVVERTATLDRVIVTGSASGAAQRSLPYAVDIVQGRDLRGAAAPTLAAALNGAIPGLWIWSDSPTALLTRFGSVRGASSFGVSSPKVFVDGIELANPLLLTRISADAIDRIEVIRGPQGAALYGADAISGVINVQLRHDGATDGRGDADVRSSAGASQSDYATGGAFTQEHTVALRAGSAERSASAVLALNSIGAIVPGGNTVQVSADIAARRVMSRTILSSTARLWVAKADSPVNPILAAVGTTVPGYAPLAPRGQQRVTQYTVGGTMTHAPDAEWTHTLTAGVDGYRLSGLSVDFVPIPSVLDSAQREAAGGADKGTLRANSVRRFGVGEDATGTLTLGTDVALLHDATAWVIARPSLFGSRNNLPFRSNDEARWLSTVGVGVQAGLNLRETVFLTAGLRGERNDGFTEASRFAVLPAVGASVVRQRGDVTWKARIAYGGGLRPARNPMREMASRGLGAGPVSTDLMPERQIGVESGVEMFWKRNLSLQVTRFDQRASSLIQQVQGQRIPQIFGAGLRRAGNQQPPGLYYALVNLGAITNRGWEFAARQSVGTLTIAGTLSLVQSRVDQIAPGYNGDLREGDRMLAVPARTTGLSVTWTPSRWQWQVAATQVADWVNYDREAVTGTYLRDGPPAYGLYGATLRTYWKEYGQVTRLRAAVSHDLTRLLTLRLIGENLLDRQRGEPDNVTIVAGRTVSFGVAARF